MKGLCIFWEETRCDALVSKNSLKQFVFCQVESLICGSVYRTSWVSKQFPCPASACYKLKFGSSDCWWQQRNGLRVWHLGDKFKVYAKSLSTSQIRGGASWHESCQYNALTFRNLAPAAFSRLYHLPNSIKQCDQAMDGWRSSIKNLRAGGTLGGTFPQSSSLAQEKSSALNSTLKARRCSEVNTI